MEAGLLADKTSNLDCFQERFVLPRGWLYSTPVSKRAHSEQVKQEYVTFQGKHQMYVLRRGRDDINTPLSYEIFRGKLEFKLVGVLPLKREIKSALGGERLLIGNKADGFIKVIHSAFAVYKWLIEDALKKEITDVAESSHPLIGFFTFRDDDIIKSILGCVDSFFPAEKDGLRKFVEKYRDELMTIKVVRKFKVIRTE